MSTRKQRFFIIFFIFYKPLQKQNQDEDLPPFLDIRDELLNLLSCMQ